MHASSGSTPPGTVRPRRTVGLALVLGTTPEAVQLGPVAVAARAGGALRPCVVSTARPDGEGEATLASFGVGVDHRVEPGTCRMFERLLPGLDDALGRLAPDAVLVHGDSAAAVAGALSATWRGVPLVHLEAPDRAPRRRGPLPEKTQRRMIAALADLHLAPTAGVVRQLLSQGVDGDRIVCTGHAGVDAARLLAGRPSRPPRTATGSRRMVVALRAPDAAERWGRGVGAAVAEVARRVPEVEILVAAGTSGGDGQVLEGSLGCRVVCLPDPGLCTLVDHLADAELVVTDADDLLVPAAALGVPALCVRDGAEFATSGAARVVGPARLVEHAVQLLTDPVAHATLVAAPNPYGDGSAGARAAAAVRWLLGVGPRPRSWLAPTSRPPGR